MGKHRVDPDAEAATRAALAAVADRLPDTAHGRRFEASLPADLRQQVEQARADTDQRR